METPGRPASVSPPNSGHKESTRLESPAVEWAWAGQAASASPQFVQEKDKSTNRSQTTGRSARTNYTKLRSRAV